MKELYFFNKRKKIKYPFLNYYFVFHYYIIFVIIFLFYYLYFVRFISLFTFFVVRNGI